MVPGIRPGRCPDRTIGAQQHDVAKGKGLEVEATQQMSGRPRIQGSCIGGDAAEQRRQTGQSAIDLEELMIDDALHDQRRLLEVALGHLYGRFAVMLHKETSAGAEQE